MNIKIIIFSLFVHYAKKNKQKQKQNVSSVMHDQVEQARQVLVGKSKSYREQYETLSKQGAANSKKISEVPAVSSSEKNSPVSKGQEGEKETDEDNEMQVDYTMDESDEDAIIREELQIADDSLPEVSPSAILTRDLSRVNGWHRNDDTIDEESETDVHERLQAIRGTQLMDYIKEATLKQEKDHQKLLAAIRKAEEAELEESNISSSSDFEMNSNVESSDSDVSEDGERPLSYYL